MPDGPLRNVPLDQILVFRALKGWGDALVAIPALRALRRARPAAHVTLVAPPEAAAYYAPFPGYVDELVAFPGWPGLPDLGDDVAAAARLVTDLQHRRLDLALQLHGSGLLTNPIVGLFGAARMAGHHLPGQWCPDPETFLPFVASTPEPLRPLRLLAHLGLAGPDADPQLELPLDPRDLATAATLTPPGPFAVVNVGASHPPRRWPADRFASVCDHLAGRGLEVALTGGPGDRPLAAAVAARSWHPLHDLTGRTSLGQLAAVVDAAVLVVTNDTGVSHVAAARGRPSVTVFCWSDVERWGPVDRHRHLVVGPASAYPPAASGSCCLGDGCARLPRPAAPDAVPEVSEVIAAVEVQLARLAGTG